MDGLRGVSALYVVLFHIVADGEVMLSADSLLLNSLRFGPEAVAVFFVLSGFVNALPVRLLVAVPIVLVCAYGFYLLFEKPFLHRRSRADQSDTRSFSASQTA